MPLIGNIQAHDHDGHANRVWSGAVMRLFAATTAMSYRRVRAALT
jgi:hypothetical protein